MSEAALICPRCWQKPPAAAGLDFWPGRFQEGLQKLIETYTTNGFDERG
ncbi:MAG: hypothetical protein IPK95_05280 [Cellvibrionales bacterium]|nr:hypothetical protein [Cellvibrionales bacterium]